MDSAYVPEPKEKAAAATGAGAGAEGSDEGKHTPRRSASLTACVAHVSFRPLGSAFDRKQRRTGVKLHFSDDAAKQARCCVPQIPNDSLRNST